MFERIADQIIWTLACVAAGQVFANCRAVARVVAALVDIYAVHSTVVFKSCLTSTRGLALLNDASAVRSTVHTVACVLANKVETLPVKWAV